MTVPERATVVIVGAGPAGLTLAQLLHVQGIDSVVLEARSRAYVERRVRAGVLEGPVAELLGAIGVGEGLARAGMVHEGIGLRFGGRTHRIDFKDLVGRGITVYGQQFVVRDLIAARVASGRPLVFEAAEVALHGCSPGGRPSVTFTHEGRSHRIACEVIAGCDGFHGVSRRSLPAGAVREFVKSVPFAWLGVLSQSPPASAELVYANHPDGFALHSMRGPEVTRQYLQVPADTAVTDWSPRRLWDELGRRLGGDGGLDLVEGPILERGLARLHGLVTEPMQHGRLFLVGDAAHIVPPTGAKGLNLAVADAVVLARLVAGFRATGDPSLLERYSELCLPRVWQVQRFSWQMTALLHRMPGESGADRRLQRAALDQVVSDRSAATALAADYTGRPLPSWRWVG